MAHQTEMMSRGSIEAWLSLGLNISMCLPVPSIYHIGYTTERPWPFRHQSDGRWTGWLVGRFVCATVPGEFPFSMLRWSLVEGNQGWSSFFFSLNEFYFSFERKHRTKLESVRRLHLAVLPSWAICRTAWEHGSAHTGRAIELPTAHAGRRRSPRQCVAPKRSREASSPHRAGLKRSAWVPARGLGDENLGGWTRTGCDTSTPSRPLHCNYMSHLRAAEQGGTASCRLWAAWRGWRPTDHDRPPPLLLARVIFYGLAKTQGRCYAASAFFRASASISTARQALVPVLVRM